MPEQPRMFLAQSIARAERTTYEGPRYTPWESKGHSLPPESDRPTKQPPRVRPTKEQLEQRLDRIRKGTAEGMTLTELARELGTTKAVVSVLKSKNGIVTSPEMRVLQQARAQQARRQRERRAGRNTLSPAPEPADTEAAPAPAPENAPENAPWRRLSRALIAKVEKRLRAGHTCEQIAQDIGLVLATVRGIAGARGGQQPQEQPPPPASTQPVARQPEPAPARLYVPQWEQRMSAYHFDGPACPKCKPKAVKRAGKGLVVAQIKPLIRSAHAPTTPATINPVRQSAQLIARTRKAKAANLYAQAPAPSAPASGQAQKARKAAEFDIFCAGERI